MRLLRLAAIALTVSPFAAACSSSSGVDSTDDALNYRSTVGQEYLLSTTLTFKLPADMQSLQGDAKAAALASYADQTRNSVANAISGELDKMWPESVRTTWPGVAIQLRQESAASRDLQELPDGAGYRFTVSAEFAAVKDITKKLPMKTEGTETYFPVTTDLGAGAQELHVLVTPVERSRNAYPKYTELFSDGFDISVHVGGDHDTPPQDISHARSVYDDLLASGFRSPVGKFEDLKVDSPPLTSTINVAGQSVDVRVRLFHVDMSTPETRNLVVDAYKNAVKNADVVIYDGHAGRSLTYSGVVLAYNPARVSIPASEFRNLESTDKQQLYLFNGCETYTGYADELYKNPARNPENTDVITTGNYSVIYPTAVQVIAFLHALIDENKGAWVPRSWDSILQRMNEAGERAWVHVYGVHGIDDDPKLSPIADASKLGAACAKDSDCGAADSRCIAASATKKVCGIACADTAGCPNGTKCVLPKGRTSSDDLQCAAN